MPKQRADAAAHRRSNGRASNSTIETPRTHPLTRMTTETTPTQRPGKDPSRGWRAEHGFTIVEVMVAALVLIVGVLSLVALVDAANGATTSNKQREAGTNLAREVIENTGTIAYDDVTPAGVVSALQARSGLEDSSPDGDYTIERRGVVFTVAVEVCNLDDPSDGLGSHTTGADAVPFCSGSGAGGSADDRSGDYRRVAVTATWTSKGETRTVTQSSFVMPPSGSDLPVVTTLTPSATPAITDNTVTDEATQDVDFTATTSSIPAGVSWSKDGTEIGEATGGGTSWNFTWPIAGLVDGDYVIGARGRTGGGSYGPEHALTMTLNRFAPLQPQNFVAGKNGTTVDAEWIANTERDIAGYTVYRQKTAPTAGTAEQVNCGTVASPVVITTSLTCTDAAPLATSPGTISLVGATELGNDTSESSTLSVSRPGGIVGGDVMIATIASSTGAEITAPAGWTQIQNIAPTGGGQGVRHASYYRVVPAGTEPASYQWNVGTARSNSGSITAWRGVDPATPIDASAQLNSGNTNQATETAPSVTTTRANGVVLRAFGHRTPYDNDPQTYLTTPTGTELRSGARSYSTVSAQYSSMKATAGATGIATSTCSSSCTQWAAHTIALKAKDALSANYWVKAVDLDENGNYREGVASSAVDAYVANTAPTAPSGLTGTAAADGSNVLSWPTPGADADTGDSVSFYRVYRDGVRYDRTALGTDATWTDGTPGSGPHTYFVKAVDTHLAESPASNSVGVTQP